MNIHYHSANYTVVCLGRTLAQTNDNDININWHDIVTTNVLISRVISLSKLFILMTRACDLLNQASRDRPSLRYCHISIQH